MKMQTNVRSLLFCGCALMALTLGACNQPEDPAKTRQDVAKAQNDAAKESQKARIDAQQKVTEAQSDVNTKISKEEADVMRTRANADYDVAATDAEGKYKVEKQRCDALAGDARDACNTDAKTAYDNQIGAAQLQRDSAKARADAMEKK